MATNKYAGICTECGETVLPGQGKLYKAWDNHKDDVAWKVKHSDATVCSAVKSAEKDAAACSDAFNAIAAYIKEFGDKQDVAVCGNKIIIDKRHGYNQVGWVVTVDEKNTIYLTSENNLDGWDMSETYSLEDCGDDGYGNSNNDIVSALISVNANTPVNVSAFAIA